MPRALSLVLLAVLLACATPAPRPPIACVVSALTPAERARSRELRTRLSGAVTALHATADGFAFALPPDPALPADVAAWMELERRCCPFLTFDLRWASGEAAPTLELSGPEGTKAFLRAELPEIGAK